jgi:hypothetical protein
MMMAQSKPDIYTDNTLHPTYAYCRAHTQQQLHKSAASTFAQSEEASEPKQIWKHKMLEHKMLESPRSLVRA